MLFTGCFILIFAVFNLAFPTSSDSILPNVKPKISVINAREDVKEVSGGLVSKKSLRIAFLGDQGLNLNSKSVLSMIKVWGAELLLIAGDFDYENNPVEFMKQNTGILGDKFPIIATAGNHDIKNWFDSGTGYRDILLKQLKVSGIAKHCDGEYGINSYCLLGNILILQSGVGTLGRAHAEYIDYIMTMFNDVPIKICMWHKNQRKMQVGDKLDETGYKVYETCRKYGAIIISGHSHTYSRSHLMSNFATQEIASTENTLIITPGMSFNAVVGLGGKEVAHWENELMRNPWWASIAALDNGANYGALLCIFDQSATSNNADCEYKDVGGRVWDTFNISFSQPEMNLFFQN